MREPCQKETNREDEMKDKDLTIDEIKILCELYKEGELNVNEEKALRAVLKSFESLPLEARETLSLMNWEKKLTATGGLKRGSNEKVLKRWWVAATIVLLLGIGTSLAIINLNGNVQEEYIVWQNGKKITGKEAKRMVEESQQIDMELLRKVMREQREMIHGFYASTDPEFYE